MTEAAQQPNDGPWPGHGKAPSSVFHYTSGAGFLGMIQSGRIWATEAAALNDYSEITAGQSFVRARWAEIRETFARDYGAAPTEVIDGVLAGAYPKLWVTGAEGAFVVCASRFDDDANQWRLYADDGRGFSVELDTSIAMDIAPIAPDDERTHQDVANVSGWRPVLYDAADRAAALDNLLNWVGNHRVARNAKTTQELIQSLPTRFAEGRMFNGIYQFIKTPGFAGENESRLVVTFAEPSDDYVEFRATKTGIARAVHLRTEIGATVETEPRPTPLPIKRVIMGPAQRYDLSAPAVRALLDRHGYGHVPVATSEASLRWS